MRKLLALLAFLISSPALAQEVSGNAPQVIEPFNLHVSRGLVPGMTLVNLFSYQAAVTTTLFPIWENVSALPLPGSALTMTLASSSASDTAVSILINGLDASYNQISETVNLNGTTGVTTANQYLRINSLRTTVGNAVGTVTVVNGGTTYAQINIGVGRNEAALYTVPAGYTAYLYSVTASTDIKATASNSVGIKLWQQAPNGSIMLNGQNAFTLGGFVRNRSLPNPYPEKTDIEYRAQTSSGTAAVAVSVEFVLVKNGSTGYVP